MFRCISDQWRLWKLKRAKRRAEKFFSAEEIRVVREKLSEDDKSEALHGAVSEIFYYEDHIAAHISLMLQNKAQSSI
jgi:hypothetical protein